MIRGEVVKTLLYPMKGMPGVDMTETGIWADPAVGVRGDRNFAIYRRPSNTPTTWKPKAQFHVCINTESMAVDCGLTEDDVDEMDGRIDPDMARGLAMGRVDVDKTSLVDTGGSWHMADTNKPCVSFLNLASVRWLEDQTSISINPHRFRMNVWIDGMEANDELHYIKGYEQGEKFPMWVKDNRLLIDDVCVRCKAIEQNPDTGKFDTELRDALDTKLAGWGYEGSPPREGRTPTRVVMGWLAIPTSTHRIMPGDPMVFSHTVPVTM